MRAAKNRLRTPRPTAIATTSHIPEIPYLYPRPTPPTVEAPPRTTAAIVEVYNPVPSRRPATR